MSMSVSEVEQAMLALDRRDLATVIHRGIQALDEDNLNDPQDDVDAVWREELRKRIDEIESGQVELLTGEKVDARVSALLAEFQR